MKGLRATKIVKKPNFEGFWGPIESGKGSQRELVTNKETKD